MRSVPHSHTELVQPHWQTKLAPIQFLAPPHYLRSERVAEANAEAKLEVALWPPPERTAAAAAPIAPCAP